MREDGRTKEILNYVAGVAEYFKSQLGPSLVDVYKMGSFAHGGFSQIYSDIDVGVILNSPNPPEGMDRLISGAKGLDPVYGKRLSVFWGNPACRWGRLRILDRLDLLDHGIPLLNNRRAYQRRNPSNTSGVRGKRLETENHRTFTPVKTQSGRPKALCQVSSLPGQVDLHVGLSTFEKLNLRVLIFIRSSSPWSAAMTDLRRKRFLPKRSISTISLIRQFLTSPKGESYLATGSIRSWR